MFAATKGGGTVLDPNTAFYVGSATGTTSIDLSGLGLQQGDLVIAATGWRGATGTPGATGYTQAAALSNSGSVDVKLYVGYKVMGSTPDTSVSFASNPGGEPNSLVHVWRRMDGSTPMAATATTATGVYPDSVNCPSISFSGSCIVLAVGLLGHTGSGAIASAPSGMGNFVRRISSSPLSHIAIASVFASTSYNPAAFSTASGGSETWCAATLALKLA